MDFFEGFNIMPNGIHIVMGSTDRPTGEAFVEFISSDEAQRGMERHRQNIGSRYIELFRATKSEMLLATGGLSSFGMAQALDPSVQLLLLQQQAAAGAFGLTGLMGTQAATGSWADMQNAAAAAASFYQRQAASLAGSPATVASSITAFDPSSSSKIRGLPYRTST
jgi:heterogeneous nuclear ribonucleoprotein F/H/epithelial splicing regulatory protein 1/2